MDGIFIRDGRPATKRASAERPKSKKEVKQIVEGTHPDGLHTGHLEIEGTSFFGDPYSGPVADAPDGEYHFCGPDPHRDRRFYGTLAKHGAAIAVS